MHSQNKKTTTLTLLRLLHSISELVSIAHWVPWATAKCQVPSRLVTVDRRRRATWSAVLCRHTNRRQTDFISRVPQMVLGSAKSIQQRLLVSMCARSLIQRSRVTTSICCIDLAAVTIDFSW